MASGLSGVFTWVQGETPAGEQRRPEGWTSSIGWLRGWLLDQLAAVPIPGLTHHLLQTLGVFIPSDPRGVFLRICQALRAGSEGGYQHESLGADLFVALVERYLAEHRGLFQRDQECRNALLDALDVFVNAGWPSARRLTYRLEDTFR